MSYFRIAGPPTRNQQEGESGYISKHDAAMPELGLIICQLCGVERLSAKQVDSLRAAVTINEQEMTSPNDLMPLMGEHASWLAEWMQEKNERVMPNNLITKLRQYKAKWRGWYEWLDRQPTYLRRPSSESLPPTTQVTGIFPDTD